MMSEPYANPDFEARITILTADQGGRQQPPHNYIRWDLGYANAEDPNALYMIWPVFLDEQGQPIAKGIPLVGTYTAHMHIVVQEMLPFHKTQIAVGTRFNCHEGSHVVATGEVTRLLALDS